LIIAGLEVIIQNMKVVVGSENKDKIEIVKKAWEELRLRTEVEGVKVDSRIGGQPLNKKVTLKGAKNRARRAKKAKPKADFWLGLEGGLDDCGKGYHLVTFGCLIDKGGREFVGEGEEIHLPEEVSGRAKKGEWFGKVIRDYAKDQEIDENLVTRLAPFTQAVQNAYAAYLREEGDLGYRKKVAAVIVDDEENFLIVQLVGYRLTDWNFCGGGIEDNETEKAAMIRELSEELGTDKFEVVRKAKQTERYDWPLYVVAKRLKEDGKTWKGQEARFFLVKFGGKRDEIRPDRGEIREVKWVRREELKDNFFRFPGQLEMAEKVIGELV
jgi:non-canonical (house-cleaning) NTP pyrophosphatase/8-oxo-dGTP pyrophosphatase MutT (NUDIX family)